MTVPSAVRYAKSLGKATRDAYGEALVELGRTNPAVVVLDADLSKSTKTGMFQKAFPDRFFNMGIMEANLVGTAAGMARSGKIPFISSFASFVINKGFDQLRLAVAFSGMNVKVVATHAGISIGEDGPSQMGIEDVALACALPGFIVCVPADEHAARALVKAAAAHHGPVYIRVGRPKAPVIYTAGDSFEFGRARTLREGRDIALVANGLLVAETLVAADALSERGISAMVLDCHTVKPLDRKAVASAARLCGAVVTAEEHLLSGGLGAAVAQALGELAPAPLEQVGIRDTYAESATPEQLMEKYGLTAPHVVRAAERALARKAGRA